MERTHQTRWQLNGTEYTEQLYALKWAKENILFKKKRIRETRELYGFMNYVFDNRNHL